MAGLLKVRDNECLEYSKQKVVGEPDEGKPHVRFDVAGNGNRASNIPRRHSLTLPADEAVCSAKYHEVIADRGAAKCGNCGTPLHR